MPSLHTRQLGGNLKTYFLRLDVGTEIVAAFSEFVAQNKIGSGSVVGLGAVKDATLGWFHSDTKTYTKQTFAQELELVGTTGTIAWLGDKPSLHLHVVLGGADGKTYAGHLFSATVAVTVELALTTSPMRIERKKDATFGLNLLDV